MTLRHRIGGYREYAPDAGAPVFCEAFWTHRTPARPLVSGAAHRVLPDPAVSVAFWSVGRDPRGLPLDSGLILVGAKTRPQLFPLTPGLEMAALRLKLEWVAPVLGIDPAALDDRIVDVSTVRWRLADRLRAQLTATRAVEDALPVLARVLVASPASTAMPAPAASAALDIVRQSSGRVPCERLAEHLGVSARHLRRQVINAAGVSTKTYGRQLRLVRAMMLADGRRDPGWASIALDSGYCDQSHLIRECVALTGIVPTVLHRERRQQRVSERSNTH
jgi:AraC-like DNA-binding protein